MKKHTIDEIVNGIRKGMVYNISLIQVPKCEGTIVNSFTIKFIPDVVESARALSDFANFVENNSDKIYHQENILLSDHSQILYNRYQLEKGIIRSLAAMLIHEDSSYDFRYTTPDYKKLKALLDTYSINLCDTANNFYYVGFEFEGSFYAAELDKVKFNNEVSYSLLLDVLEYASSITNYQYDRPKFKDSISLLNNYTNIKDAETKKTEVDNTIAETKQTNCFKNTVKEIAITLRNGVKTYKKLQHQAKSIGFDVDEFIELIQRINK